jgi:uncharacterized protein DUF3536/glycosyl hydrolase family 57
VGPTLLSWLAAERPDVYARIVEADRLSVAARGGHGNAIAQPYNHMIMPLASRRDKVTQVRWGLADFRFRFGREPEGMWLPETAVDAETLEVLVEHGVGFTILAPKQAGRVRALPDGRWEPAGVAVDPSRPYRWTAPDGRGLALFFYDGPISHAVAFEGLLASGDAFAARLMAGFDDRRRGAQLVHIATDGESYGHHHAFGDMALAAACDGIERQGQATLTNYGAFLAACPPSAEAEVVGPSSWSCAHGVERWRADCGCNSGRPGWHQRWRGPLREALDWLRDQVDPLFEARAGALVKDPWAARDDYIHVVLDRSPANVSAFFARHRTPPLSPATLIEGIKLFELQRHRLLMYTSCGWFFDEVSGIETVQVLKYAARVVQLARELGAADHLEEGFFRRLAAGPSNLPELGSGDLVFRRHVLPALVDLRRVMAHYAIAAPYQAYGETAKVYAYTISREEWQREAYGETSLTVGRLRATSDVTMESAEAAVAVLHFGGHDFQCAMRPLDPVTFGRVREDLFRHFAGHGLSDVVRALDGHFGGKGHGLRDLFLEERRKILATVTDGVLRRFEETYRHFYEETRRLLEYLREVDARPPEAIVLAARYVLARDLEAELAELAQREDIPNRIKELVAEARTLGIDLALERERVAPALERALLTRMFRLWDVVTPARVEGVVAVIQVGQRMGCVPDLWAAQNRLYELWRAQDAAGRALLAPLATALGFTLAGA